ncbi:MAG: hypothetical protein CMN30_24735 [Sandaracinus sp.]|nr:hypothetical protein [Sandaracinus sp.]|tara:strand:+ start:3676 stop:4224 length:549 start_codon:yes stop_codon:yes gene_type:complete
MRVPSILGLTLLGALASGCIFNNVSAEERLRDSVVGLNDEVRWNRMDLATQRVAPAYRSEFSLTHHEWHERMQIADSEIIHVQVGETRDEAMAYVTVRWYDQSTMLVAETTIEQKWEKEGRGYILADEGIRSGDARLLALPEGFEHDEDGNVRAIESDEEVDEEAETEDAGETAALATVPAG